MPMITGGVMISTLSFHPNIQGWRIKEKSTKANDEANTTG